MPDPHEVPQDSNGFFLEAPVVVPDPHWAHPLGILTAEKASALISKDIS